MSWAKTLTFTPGFDVIRTQETLTGQAGIGNAGMFYNLGISQRPAYRFKLNLGPLQRHEVESLTAHFNYHRSVLSFYWNGHPYNTLENYAAIGETDGTRTEFFLLNNYIDPNSISVRITSGNGNSSVTTSFTLSATPGLITFGPTAPRSGFQVEAQHAHRYRVFFGPDLTIRTERRGLYFAELELTEQKIAVSPRGLT